jgi:uncharacterized protein YjiS (DUF1127 family)
VRSGIMPQLGAGAKGPAAAEGRRGRGGGARPVTTLTSAACESPQRETSGPIYQATVEPRSPEDAMTLVIPIARSALREQEGRSPKEVARHLVYRAAGIVKVWRRRAETRGDLACLDDRMLADMGLTRQQALAEIRKPFWRA